MAEADGHLLGFSHLALGASHALAPPGRPAELLRLYVREPFTHRGVGSRLLATAEDAARAGGSDVLWLTHWVHDQRAQRFHARHGYSDHGLTSFTFEGESHDHRPMARRLRAD